MTSLKDLSISKKLMRMSMTVATAVLLCSCGAFVAYELVTFRSSTAERLATEADMAGIDVTSGMLFNDTGAAGETLSALRANPSIRAAAVYASDGRLFARYVQSGAASAMPERLPMSPDSDRIEGNRLIVQRQIVADHKPIGMIYIRSDLREMAGRLRSYALIVLAALIASFGLAGVVSSALQKRISAPLLRLTETARSIGSQRDYSVRAPVAGNDEIGTLSDAFNDMLRQIENQNATLQESERHFHELADAMPQMVWATGGSSEPYFNRRWFEYTGVIVGPEDTFGWTTVIHPDDVQTYLEVRAESLRTGSPFTMELRIRRASDGAYRWHLARALPVRDEEAHVIRWFGTYTDIDDHKRAEAEILQINAELENRVLERTENLTAANAELANANEAKDRFLATMSHELRTPLNAIIGFTGTLLMKLAGPLNAEQETHLQTVRVSARHLLSLINDLLDLAKIDSGKVQLHFEQVSCRSVVNEVAAVLAPLEQAKGLRFEVLLPDDDVVVSADHRALSQIVINLGSNAIKFTEDGFVRLEVKKLDTTAPKVEISVTDSGIGIPEPDQKKLFQAFVQGQSTRKRVEGTGLGLYLSQRLAVLIGGQIVFRSEVGSGSRFSLAL